MYRFRFRTLQAAMAFAALIVLYTYNCNAQEPTGPGFAGMPRYQLDLQPHELPRPDSPGAKLVAKYCSQCHSIPSPLIHQGNEWDRALDRMFWRIDSLNARNQESWWPWASTRNRVLVPAPDERELLTQYIKKNSIRPARKIPESGSAAAEAFKYTCTLCHALPDPALHSAAEWSTSIDKMQKHLEGTIYGPMEKDEKDFLLAYLKRNGRRF